MNLNHLHLHVRSVARASAFYERFFGLRRHAVHDGDVLFMRDDAGMDLALAPSAEVEAFPAWFHIGFRLRSADEVKALHDAMAAADVVLKAPFTVEGDFAFFRCADPDGYQIEIYYEPDPS